MTIEVHVQFYNDGSKAHNLCSTFSRYSVFFDFLSYLRKHVPFCDGVHFDIDVYIDDPAIGEYIVLYGAL